MRTEIKKVPLYPCRLGVIISDNEQEISKFAEEHGGELKIDFREENALTVDNAGYKDENGGYYFCIYIVFNADRLSHETIAHEIAHAVNCIFRRIEYNLERDNDEAQAYLAGWVAGFVYESLGKSGLYGQITPYQK